MKENVELFLKSNLLHQYVIGETSTSETIEVERYIANYAAVKTAYQTLQNNLELKAKFDAVEAPQHILDSVLDTIQTQTEPKVVTLQKRKTPWYFIAASVAAILFAITSVILYKNNQNLKQKNNTIVKETSEKTDPDAKKFLLTGNERAKDLKTVAYINPVKKTSMLDVIALPELPEEHYYQIWAELQDKMVKLEVLTDSINAVKKLPYVEDALALSITIENKKDSTTTHQNNEVAEVVIK